ncbi:hypothetical protein QC761_0056020 [Podospora bellae-mahoneyi]|uniref:Uncharacterized protein n=1 Tax=Podospora bellae-mahoneyi TaxID=2093777 RepID=A0ABR0FPE4_9PEZI|nr:hypothetical protein QC761_0056020 [Podospora bellae-mahoneyi]
MVRSAGAVGEGRFSTAAEENASMKMAKDIPQGGLITLWHGPEGAQQNGKGVGGPKQEQY